MDSHDVVVVGGGPGGASCAWRLARAGADVLVLDAKPFPRDKVCAGWITPPVLAALEIDAEDYRVGRTFQPITGFRVGTIGDGDGIEAGYGEPVSFGIRRCEFDHYLLDRSRARLSLGTPVSRLRRAGGWWVVNEAVRAPVLVGAGGHFCPVARSLNGTVRHAPLVAAQEAEFAIEGPAEEEFRVRPEIPELYFSRDLTGYGWCFRKGSYVNVGFGSLGRALPAATTEFVRFLTSRGRVPGSTSWRFCGHAYLLSDPPIRRVAGDGVLLVGDAAGLAYPESGEGIRPAVESGLLAASAILDAGDRASGGRFADYERRLRARFAPRSRLRLSRAAPAWLRSQAARWLFGRPWFVRNVLLDRLFLHAR
jgi:flavin-dependent dehydrogenase